MRESNDLRKLELHDLYAYLKAYDFELEVRIGQEPLSSQPTKALTIASSVTNSSTSSPAETMPKRTVEQINDDVMSLFVKKFSRFMKNNHRTYQNAKGNIKKESSSSDMACFNCEKIDHFIADCPKPKKDDFKKKQHKRNAKNSERTAILWFLRRVKGNGHIFVWSLLI